MDGRKKDSQDKDEKLSTAKIATVLHEHSEVKLPDLSESTASSDKLELHKSYRPTKLPPAGTEYVNRLEGLRLDRHNLRFNKSKNMLFYLPKDHSEYREHPDDVEEGTCYDINCTIL